MDMDKPKASLAQRHQQHLDGLPREQQEALKEAFEASDALRSSLWPLWPVMFVMGCWATLLCPDSVLRVLPKLPVLAGPISQEAASLLKLFPRTRAAAWELGHLTARWQTNDIDGQAAVQAAAQVLQLDARMALQLTPDQLLALGQALKGLEAPGGAWSKVTGLLSFANLLWCAGAIGVAVWLRPAVQVLLGPLLRSLYLNAYLATIWVHTLLRPFYPAASYGACMYAVGAALRYSDASDATTAPLIALSGVVVATAQLVWQMVSHRFPSEAPTSEAGRTAKALGAPFFINLMLLLSLAPLAAAHQSSLAGFVASAGLFGMLGFTVMPIGLAWLVGWSDEGHMLHTAAASASILALLLGSRAAGVDVRLLQPFNAGLSVFGSVCLLLSGLIRSNRWYSEYENKEARKSGTWNPLLHTYVGFNMLYALLLMVTTLGGAFYGNAGMFNTGATFVALFIAEKIAEATPQGLMAPLGLAFSGVLLWVAYFIKERPDWLAAMLQQ